MASTAGHDRPLTPESSTASTTMSDAELSNDAIFHDPLKTALQVIRTERDALTTLEDIYENDLNVQKHFCRAVDAISNSVKFGGRIVVCGCGKSGKVGQKFVATMNSFGIRSVFLHPVEALHGDLGMIGENDAIFLITFSGKTPEILALLPHLPLSLPLIALTSRIHQSNCELFVGRDPKISILLPAPIPVPEAVSFGVAAPTTSTTVALALSDAVAIAVARRLHPNPANVFKSYHPGGTIGGIVKVVNMSPESDCRQSEVLM